MIKLWSAIKSGVLWLVAAIVALAVLLFGARRSGRDAERAARIEDDLERADEVDQIRDQQLEIAANRARDDDELERRLRDGTFGE